MDRTGRQIGWLVAILVVDVLAVGMGMGVPAFAILAAAPLGVVSGRRHAAEETRAALAGTLREGAIISAITFLLMLGIWGTQLGRIAEPAFDAAEWGIPLVLYSSTASFWGWMALMIVVSPVLQFLLWATCAEAVVVFGHRTAD